MTDCKCGGGQAMTSMGGTRTHVERAARQGGKCKDYLLHIFCIEVFQIPASILIML